MRGWQRYGWLAAATLAVSLVLAAFGPQPAQAATAIPTHALPISYDPAQNAVLATPPSAVVIKFSEQLNGDISRLVVVNPSNQEVDSHDSHILGDELTMSVSLPLLPAGTYIVFWQSHSADDGHVASGSYLFHIERADGTVPPLTGPLPSGPVIGGGGVATTGALDGPNVVAFLAHWFGLLALTVLLGLIFWRIVVLPRQIVPAGFREQFAASATRLAQLALEVVIVETAVEVLAQAVIVDGSINGMFSLPRIAGILTQSRFGQFITLRAVVALLGLIVLRVPALAQSLRARNQQIAQAVFGLGLALAFVYSGHGGSASQAWGPPVDFIHLLADGVWLGGLFTLVLVAMPLIGQAGAAARSAYFAASVPVFSIPALVSVAVLAITGPLNASTRMTAFSQMWTTAYGIVLTIKILLFIVMAIFSYLHAYRLRPRLAATQPDAAGPAAGGGLAPGVAGNFLQRLDDGRRWLETRLAPANRLALASGTGVAPGATAGGDAASIQQAQWARDDLTHGISRLMRLEAGIGVAVLFCAALLAPLAGTLAPPPPSASSFGAAGGPQTLTQTVDGLKVTLSVAPGHFGANTFNVVVANPDGTPASGGAVFLVTTMVEMDMGTNTINLAAGSAPGTYTGSGDLPMAGHWKVEVVVRLANDTNLHRVTFTVAASF